MANDNHYGFDTKALHKWWRDLDEHRGRRARLRRCHTLEEVMDTLAFEHYARPRLFDAGLDGNDEQLAAVAGLLAHIREHAPEHPTFAAQMATPDISGGRPPVSEMRFRRLLRKKSRAQLYRPLRRVLHILGTPPRANILAVTRDVLYWRDGVRRQWAQDYYAVLFGSEPVDKADSRGAVWQAWWCELQQPERRGERAALRRCHTPREVMLTAGYHRLLHYLKKTDDHDERSKRQHAAVAGLLAHIEENDKRHCFAAQMALSDRAADELAEADAEERGNKQAEIQNGKYGSAPLSGLRFRRLLQIDDRQALFRRLIRTLHLLGGRANLKDVANAVFYWGNKERRDWSLDYYTHVPYDEP